MSKKRTRKVIQSSLATAVAVSTVAAIAPTTEAASVSFRDVSADAYYFNAVQQLTQKGVISGYPDGTFKPNNAVTRAEFTAFLVKMLQLDTNSVSNPNFPDVHTNAWYYSSVATLANLGLVGGYEDGSFQPNKTITRAEIAALLTRICDLKADSNTALPFTDVPANAWYKDVVAALYQSKLVSGKTLTTFAPNDNATRAEATVFLQRAEAAGLLPTTPKAPEASATIEAVTNESVTIDGVTYKFAEDLKGIFNATNSASLTNAKVAFTATNKVITKVESLEINASGQAVTAKDEEEFSKNVVFDGGKTTIDGLLTINGNYVSIKNLTVSGKTIINGTNNVFFDAKLNTVEISKKDAAVTLKGTTVKDLIIPVGTKAKDYIKNYDDVKKNIAKINGKTNPDASVGGGGGGGTGSGGSVTTPSTDLVITDDYGTDTIQTINKDIVVKTSENITIKNLDATGKKITVEGTGKVTLLNVTVGELTTPNDTKYRSIAIQGTTTIANTNIKSGAALSVVKPVLAAFLNTRDIRSLRLFVNSATNPSFGAIEINPPAGAKIALSGDFGNSTIAVKSKVTVEVGNGTKLEKLILEAEVTLDGDGVGEVLEKIQTVGDTKVTFSEKAKNALKTNPSTKPLYLLTVALNDVTWSKISNGQDAKIVTKALNLANTITVDGETVSIKWEAYSPDLSKKYDINSGKIEADDKDVVLIATLSYGDKQRTKSFNLHVDTIQGVNEAPYIQYISFKDIVSYTDKSTNTIKADLSKVNTSSILKAEIGVSEASTLKLTVDGIAEFDGINLQDGKNSIETKDLFSNITFRTLHGDLDLSDLYEAIEDSEIDRLAIIEGIDFSVLFAEMDKVPADNLAQIYQSINMKGIFELLQNDSIPEETKEALIEHMNLGVIFDAIQADKPTNINHYLALFDSLTKNLIKNTGLPLSKDDTVEETAGIDSVSDLLNLMLTDFDSIPPEYKKDIYASIDFELVFNILSELSSDTKTTVYKAPELRAIFEIVTTLDGTIKTGIYDILVKGLPGVLTAIEGVDNINRTAILNAIDLSNIYKSTGGGEGLSLELFKFLAKMDGAPDNVITLKATLTDVDGIETPYTINMTIPSSK